MSTKNNNRLFFHGSMYLSRLIAPSFYLNGGHLRTFQNGLTNEWLYVSTNKEVAMQSAICSVVNNLYDNFHQQCDDMEIIIHVSAPPERIDLSEVAKRRIYVYAIPELFKANTWHSLGSLADNTELYTKASIAGMFSIESFTIEDALAVLGSELTIITSHETEEVDEQDQFFTLSSYR